MRCGDGIEYPRRKPVLCSCKYKPPEYRIRRRAELRYHTTVFYCTIELYTSCCSTTRGLKSGTRMILVHTVRKEHSSLPVAYHVRVRTVKPDEQLHQQTPSVFVCADLDLAVYILVYRRHGKTWGELAERLTVVEPVHTSLSPKSLRTLPTPCTPGLKMPQIPSRVMVCMPYNNGKA